MGNFSAYDNYDGLFYGDFADDWKYPVMEGHEAGFVDTTVAQNGKKGERYLVKGF